MLLTEKIISKHILASLSKPAHTYIELQNASVLSTARIAREVLKK
jgi:hypothetical protein